MKSFIFFYTPVNETVELKTLPKEENENENHASFASFGKWVLLLNQIKLIHSGNLREAELFGKTLGRTFKRNYEHMREIRSTITGLVKCLFIHLLSYFSDNKKISGLIKSCGVLMLLKFQ